MVSIAGRYVGPAREFFELVSDGNMPLIKAVEKFDVSRGNKSSTYASWAIMNRFPGVHFARALGRHGFLVAQSPLRLTAKITGLGRPRIGAILLDHGYLSVGLGAARLP